MDTRALVYRVCLHMHISVCMHMSTYDVLFCLLKAYGEPSQLGLYPTQNPFRLAEGKTYKPVVKFTQESRQ